MIYENSSYYNLGSSILISTLETHAISIQMIWLDKIDYG